MITFYTYPYPENTLSCSVTSGRPCRTVLHLSPTLLPTTTTTRTCLSIFGLKMIEDYGSTFCKDVLPMACPTPIALLAQAIGKTSPAHLRPTSPLRGACDQMIVSKGEPSRRRLGGIQVSGIWRSRVRGQVWVSFSGPSLKIPIIRVLTGFLGDSPLSSPPERVNIRLAYI